MTYLTQILVPYELAVRQLRIRDSYDWHQRIWQAFAGRDGEKRDFLSRVDEIDDAYRLLIASRTPPSKPDWCPTDCFQSKPIPESFFEHHQYRFSLLANPTRKVRVETEAGQRKKNGRRLPITQRIELIAWLQRKGLSGGFHLCDPEQLRIIPKGRVYFHKPGAHGMHHAVEFQGTLSVTDPSAFRASFITGIGSAKGFGFGLLAIVPLS